MIMPNRKTVFFVILAFATLLPSLAGVPGCSVAKPAELTSITIEAVNNAPTEGTVVIAAQTLQQFKATGHYSDWTTADLTSSADWRSSDSSIAAISSTTHGLYAAAVASSGTCTVTAAYQRITASVQLYIKNLPLQSITVSPASAIMHWNLALQFTATGIFSNGTETISGQDITTVVSWSSSMPAIVSIDDATNKGLANTNNTSGSAVITAQWNGITSPGAMVFVSAEPLESIIITAPPSTFLRAICGDTSNTPKVQLTAMGRFGDGSEEDVTAQVVWQSLNPEVVTVDNNGLVTALAPGDATVSATVGDITNTLQLVVYVGCEH
jgi:Bacterial Ig-like domain (group 2)